MDDDGRRARRPLRSVGARAASLSCPPAAPIAIRSLTLGLLAVAPGLVFALWALAADAIVVSSDPLAAFVHAAFVHARRDA